MDSEKLKEFGTKALLSTAGIIGINVLGVNDKIRSVLPNSVLTPHLSSGAGYTLVKAGVDMGYKGESVFQKQLIDVSDDVAFYTGLSLGVNTIQINDKVYDALGNFVGNSQLQYNLTEGLTVASGSILADVLDQTTGDNIVFDMIRKPVSTTLKLLNKN